MITLAQKQRAKYWEELSNVAGALASNCSKLLKHKGKVYGNIIDGGHLWSSENTITVNPEFSEREDATKLEPVDTYLSKNLLVNLAAEFPEFANINFLISIAGFVLGFSFVIFLVNFVYSWAWGPKAVANPRIFGA